MKSGIKCIIIIIIIIILPVIGAMSAPSVISNIHDTSAVLRLECSLVCISGSVGMRRMSSACTSRADITGGPRHNRVTWYVKTFRNVNYVC